MKIILLDAATLGEANLEGFKQFGEVEIFQTTSKDETLKRVTNAEIVITNKVRIDKEVLKSTKILKLICIAATGINNVDLKIAKELGIGVSNVSGYSTSSVVCHTFSMLFYLSSHSRYYDEYTRYKKWCESNIFTHLKKPFFELEEKKWGIVGLGTIGKRVASAALSFGCQLSYYSTSGTNLNQPYEHKSLEELLKTSDIVSIHAPLNKKTYNLIDLKKLALMKDDAILLNLGRGGLINEKDLAIALNEGRIKAAGLDVLEKEPPDKDNPLFHIKYPDKLFITPHIAWASREARNRLVEEILQNIKAFLSGKERNRVENKLIGN